MTLRTPPVKPTVLALKQRIVDGGLYSDGRPINSVIADLYDRIGVTNPDPDPEPEPPSTTALTDEQFDEGGLDGQAPSTLNTSASAVTGSGTLSLSGAFVVTGGLGLELDGTALHYLEYAGYTAHANHYASLYWEHTRNPSADAWILAGRNGIDSATAWQIGIDSTGHLIIRDGDSGGTDDTASFAFTAGADYRWDITVAPSSLTVRIYGGTNVNSSNTANALDTLTCAISSTTFTGERLGLLAAISGTGSATGNLTNATFESGSNGDAAADANAGGAWFGTSGNCKISTSHPQNGTRGLRIGCAISAPDYRSGRYDNASHANHYATFFLYVVAAGSGNTIIYQLRDGGGSTTAAEIGVNSSRQLVIRNGTSAVDTSVALTANTMYRVDATYAGSGDQTVRYYTGANLLSTNTADATETLTGALTATNFSHDLLGLIATATGSPDIFIDDFRSDSAALPVGTVAVGIGGYIDRFMSDSAALPEPATTTTPPPTQAGWIPTTGAYAMATTGTAGTQGSSSPQGMSTYLGITGNIRPHGVHVYITATNWSGIPTTTERNLFRPSGQAAAMPVWTWKINTGLTWAQIAGGAADNAIRNAARGLAQYGHWQGLSFYHEPDNDSTFRNGVSGYSASDYRNMWRHAVAVMRAQWAADNVLNPQVWFYVNWAGHSNLAGTNGANFANMYPGDDVIDSISWNPYWDATSRTGLGLTQGLLNENWNNTSGWDGFYTWATTPRTDFSGAKPLGLGEWGPSFTNLSDSQAATRLQQMIDGIGDYPQLKWVSYWNSSVSGAIDSQLYGHPLASAKYQDFVELTYMTQTVE